MREIKIPKRKTKKNRLFNDLTETFTSRLTSSQEDKGGEVEEKFNKINFFFICLIFGQIPYLIG